MVSYRSYAFYMKISDNHSGNNSCSKWWRFGTVCSVQQSCEWV